MSNISLEGNASGTGTFTIAAPNTSSNFTLTLPQASGTIALGTGLTGVTDSASPFETSLGEGAGGSSTGAYNTFIGFEAGNDNTTGVSNTAVGYLALSSNTTGQRNIAIGAPEVGFVNAPLQLNTTGTINTAIGTGALGKNTTGGSNVAMGYQSLSENTTASNNVAIGQDSLKLNTTGAGNTAVGYQAADSCTTGNDNTAYGKGSLGALTTGDGNIGIGYNANSSVTTGVTNIHVGYDTVSSGTGATTEIVIGRTSGSSTTGKGNNTGFITPNGGGVFQGNNSSSWSTTSDQRLKKNIVDNTEGLDKVSAIRVRNFEYRLPEEVTDLPNHTAIQKTGVQLGVIAQELQQVCPDCVTEQSTGVLSVDTDEIFWHMVNAIKDLKAINDAQATRIETLETKVTALEAQLATPPAEPNA